MPPEGALHPSHILLAGERKRERERKKLVSSHISSAGERKREREKEARILRVHRCRPLTTHKRERERERERE
jgi:hypothetical protein